MLSEFALRKGDTIEFDGLNPCFNGICSLSERRAQGTEGNIGVLILVLMEYAL